MSGVSLVLLSVWTMLVSSLTLSLFHFHSLFSFASTMTSLISPSFQLPLSPSWPSALYLPLFLFTPVSVLPYLCSPFPCFTLFVFHSFRVSPFPYVTLFVSHAVRVSPYLCFTLFMSHLTVELEVSLEASLVLTQVTQVVVFARDRHMFSVCRSVTVDSEMVFQ